MDERGNLIFVVVIKRLCTFPISDCKELSMLCLVSTRGLVHVPHELLGVYNSDSNTDPLVSYTVQCSKGNTSEKSFSVTAK